VDLILAIAERKGLGVLHNSIHSRAGAGWVVGRAPRPAAVYTASSAAICMTASAGLDFIV